MVGEALLGLVILGLLTLMTVGGVVGGIHSIRLLFTDPHPAVLLFLVVFWSVGLFGLALWLTLLGI